MYCSLSATFLENSLTRNKNVQTNLSLMLFFMLQAYAVQLEQNYSGVRF